MTLYCVIQGPSTPEKTGTSEAARPLVRGANPGPVRQSHGMEARQRQSEKVRLLLTLNIGYWYKYVLLIVRYTILCRPT